jgi:hypothetical protein
MKRWTLKLTLALLAGAVVTWAVAWGSHFAYGEFGFERDSVRAHESQFLESERVFYVYTWQRLAKTTVFVNRFPGPRFPDAGKEIARPPLTASIDVWNGATIEAYGLPWRALRRARTWQPVEELIIGRAPLPIGVLPLGFTLNTLLAAAVILTLTEGAGAWRRRARRRKGKCPWCGYDRAGVAGDAACPECGRV